MDTNCSDMKNIAAHYIDYNIGSQPGVSEAFSGGP